MIVEVYRGNGLTQLIEEEDYELEKPHKDGQQIGSSIYSFSPDCRNRGKVKGCFVGRDGVAVLLDHLCGCRWKGKK